jgi:hypothetical protein
VEPDTRFFRRDPLIENLKQSDIPYPENLQKRAIDPWEFFLHHSDGNECRDWSHEAIEATFSSTGFDRGYAIRDKDNVVTGHRPSYHQFAQVDSDLPNYAQVQFALHYHSGEWCLVPIVRYTLSDVCWHCGDTKYYPENNEMNTRSMALEICGDFEFKSIDLEALDYLASILKPYHQYLVEKLHIPEELYSGIGLTIFGHRDVANTVCPGRIYEQLPYLRERVYS